MTTNGNGNGDRIISVQRIVTAKNCRPESLEKILLAIKGGAVKQQVEEIRRLNQAGQKAEADALKNQLQPIIFAGEFRERNKAGLQRHSGLIILDVDHVKDPAAIRDAVSAEPCVKSAFRSPNDGVKILVAVNATTAEEHEHAFEGARAYFEKQHGIKIDASGRDVCRVCFISFDPNAFIRDGDATPLVYAPIQDVECFSEIAGVHGPPFTRSPQSGKITLNQKFFVALLARTNNVLFCSEDESFYLYNPANGAWEFEGSEKIAGMFSDLLGVFHRGYNEPQFLTQRTYRLTCELTGGLKTFVCKKRPFQKTRPSDHAFIHCANGMLRISRDGVELMPHNPAYLSRNASPIPWNPAAECPRFLGTLLADALDLDDISLLQRIFGAVLIGGNVAQRMIILHGTAGGGKGTIISILEHLVGEDNVGQIRTAHLEERFEKARFIGKSLLTGKDVAENYLCTPSANELKSMSGHDLTSTESKNSNREDKFRGDVAIIITSNARLRMRFRGDVEAWRRRLLTIEFTNPPPVQRDARLKDHIFANEMAGVLRWAAEGAIQHLIELEEVGDFKLTPAAAARNNDLIDENDSLRLFLKERITKTAWDAPGGLTTEEIVEAYCDFCDEHRWGYLGPKGVERALPKAMAELFQVFPKRNLERDGKRARGYLGVEFKRS